MLANQGDNIQEYYKLLSTTEKCEQETRKELDNRGREKEKRDSRLIKITSQKDGTLSSKENSDR